MRFIVEGPVSMWMPIAVACLLAAGAAGRRVSRGIHRQYGWVSGADLRESRWDSPGHLRAG